MITFPYPLTLVGGGALDRQMLVEAMALAPELVAADGAADRLADWELLPQAIIGDMDSIRDSSGWAARTRVLHLPEQDTTDFEKCLYATEAPFYVAAGFTGQRIDHTLAVFHAMLRHPDKRVILLGEAEALAMVPPGVSFSVELEAGARVSLFPLLPVTGTLSEGLEWSISGLEMAPGKAIGTSNNAVASRVAVRFESPGVLFLVERRFLGALVSAISSADSE
ncbi:MAG: thiamine diphosphokinase [Paracoccaceae bacterium]